MTATRPAGTTLATIAVGLMAAALSYDHMRLLAVTVGEPSWRAALLPLTVDGLVVVATRVTITRRGNGEPVGWLAYTALTSSVVASLAANVVSGDPTLVPAHGVRWVVSAWPPLAVAMAFELALQARKDPDRPPAAAVGDEDQPGEATDQTAGQPATAEPSPAATVERTVARASSRTAVRATDPALDPDRLALARAAAAELRTAGRSVNRANLADQLRSTGVTIGTGEAGRLALAVKAESNGHSS